MLCLSHRVAFHLLMRCSCSTPLMCCCCSTSQLQCMHWLLLCVPPVGRGFGDIVVGAGVCLGLQLLGAAGRGRHGRAALARRGRGAVGHAGAQPLCAEKQTLQAILCMPPASKVFASRSPHKSPVGAPWGALSHASAQFAAPHSECVPASITAHVKVYGLCWPLVSLQDCSSALFAPANVRWHAAQNELSRCLCLCTFKLWHLLS